MEMRFARKYNVIFGRRSTREMSKPIFTHQNTVHDAHHKHICIVQTPLYARYTETKGYIGPDGRADSVRMDIECRELVCLWVIMKTPRQQPTDPATSAEILLSKRKPLKDPNNVRRLIMLGKL